MAYTMLRNTVKSRENAKTTLEGAALAFIRDSCEGLRFNQTKAVNISGDFSDREGCIYRPDRAHCTAFQCMASADTVHAFRSSVHDDYSGIGIPASVNRASSSSTLSSR